MIFTVNDWVLDVEVETNMRFSSAQAAEHCCCGYCRNFYRTIDATYPDMRPFLAQFGLNVEGPDEFSPFEPTICEVTYIVNGSIVKAGSSLIEINGIPVAIKTAGQADMETERPLPYFVFVIGLMELPWVIEEPMEDVISPANEEAYLQRMWKKLLYRAEQESLYS